MAFERGDRLAGRYRILEPLAAGGMGAVFLAVDEPSGKRCALKELKSDEPLLLESFRNEFAVLGRVTHPHLTRVLDFGSERVRGQLAHYYAAEWVEGVTLAEHARLGSTEQSLSAWLDALEGLGALHVAGIRHGDFTPGNVVVRRNGQGVLIDLGCARPFGRTDLLCGTPGYLAPELLEQGYGDARSDLYAAGASLREITTASRAKTSSKHAALIARLLAADPRDRPGDVNEVLEHFARQSRRAATVRPLQLLEREREIAVFERWLGAFLRAEPGARVLSIAAERGLGVTRLLRECVWRAQLEVRTLRATAAEPAAVTRLVAELCGSQPAAGALALANALSALESPLVLVVEDHDRLESSERLLLHTLARLLDERSLVALVVSGRSALAPGETVTPAPLSRSAVRSWCGARFSDRQVRELHEQSRGRPAELERLLSRTERAATDASFSEQALRDPARRTLAMIVALGGSCDAALWPVAGQELEALVDSGLLVRDGSRFELMVGAENAVTALELQRAHQRIAELVADHNPAKLETSARDATVVQHLALAGDTTAAEQLFFANLEAWESDGRSVAAALEPLWRGTKRAGVAVACAELLLRVGDNRQAISAAARSRRASASDEESERALLVVAAALVRLGRATRAERLLRRAFERHPHAARSAALYECLARARLQRGDYDGARGAAERGLELARDRLAQGLLHEVLGVALTYLGQGDQAELELHQALASLGEAASPRDRCRVLSQRAIASFRAGRLDSAIADHARALSLAERHGLEDLLPVTELNLGTAEQQAGQLGAALQSYERGLVRARAVGRESTELTLLYNLANLYAELGAFDRAEGALSRLERRASGARLEHFAPAIALVRAELALAQGDAARAIGELDQAELLLRPRGPVRELVEVQLRRVDALLLRAEAPAARALLESIAADAEKHDDLAVALAYARARVAAAASEPSARELFAQAQSRAQRSGLRLLEAEVASEQARLAGAARDTAAAAEHGARARRLWDRLALDLPQALLELFWRHPERAGLSGLTQLVPLAAGASGAESEALRRLLSLNRRLNSSLSVEHVLDYALEAATELSGAERGFLVLRQGEGFTLHRSAAGSAEGPSRSIVERALEREEPVLTTDAEADSRFAEQRSVLALRLKSVLCVPIVSPSGTLGALYMDSRVQRGRFTTRERELLLAFADQVALALVNARLHAELARQKQEIEEQKRALERLSRGQAREIERLQKQVENAQHSLALRYDYSQIAGRGAAMQSVFARLDRVTDSTVSVLIEGESGTGKELVARAIHFNGPRKGGAFVGINCAALPENLLESELFGHVRGAFTGADRDKVGLMQAANGGTLFLDELGEMPLSTQAKLLRVLQEREARPLGATKAVPLDLRLVCATHRDLLADVEAGRFREDLYYRVAVVQVRMPPLRERIEDLPELCGALLNKVGRDTGRRTPEIAADALRALATHRWPGNVRELENTLTRASVLCSGERISARDLELESELKPGRRSSNRREFESDERERILHALRGARWNVSIVSRALGIPRNTLYRKLARYDLRREPMG